MEARLRAAEEEAARLRKELEAVQQESGRGGDEGEDGRAGGASRIVPAPAPQKPKLRYDSTGYRETIFDMGTGIKKPSKELGNLMGNGLSEAELFLTKGGASREAMMENNVDQSVVRRYVLVGGVSTAASVALSFWRFQPKPKYSADYYLERVLIAQSMLPDLADSAADGDWDGLVYGLNRLTGDKGGALDLRKNLLGAAATLDNVDKVDGAKAVAFDALGFIDNADYRVYFDTQGRVPAGPEAIKAAAFTAGSLRAANRELQRFTGLMTAEAVAAAMERVPEQYLEPLAGAREEARKEQAKQDAGRAGNDGVAVKARDGRALREEEDDLAAAVARVQNKIDNPAPYDTSILEESWRLSEEADDDLE